jgi:IS30 family transposase
MKKRSPEQISGWLARNENIYISHETIYQFIRKNKEKGGLLYLHLRYGHKRKRRTPRSQDFRGQIKNRVSIEKRPEIVDQKTRIGDWEIDTVHMKGRKECIVTIVERVSRFALAAFSPDRTAKYVTEVIVKMLTPYKNFVHTITTDNGKEFAYHEEIARELKTKIYFAHPYSSWERGLNENTNGLLRQYYPKSDPFRYQSKNSLPFIVDELNNRPRKCLKFASPMQVFFDKVKPSRINHRIALIT